MDDPDRLQLLRQRDRQWEDALRPFGSAPPLCPDPELVAAWARRQQRRYQRGLADEVLGYFRDAEVLITKEHLEELQDLLDSWQQEL